MIRAAPRRHQLKRVYATPFPWEAREILTLLEQQRIAATLLNEHVAGTPGVLPFNAQMTVDAEVWVLDDELVPRCERLIAEYQAALQADRGAATDTVWRCESCREENPARFELCWSCGRSRH